MHNSLNRNTAVRADARGCNNYIYSGTAPKASAPGPKLGTCPQQASRAPATPNSVEHNTTPPRTCAGHHNTPQAQQSRGQRGAHHSAPRHIAGRPLEAPQESQKKLVSTQRGCQHVGWKQTQRSSSQQRFQNNAGAASWRDRHALMAAQAAAARQPPGPGTSQHARCTPRGPPRRAVRREPRSRAPLMLTGRQLQRRLAEQEGSA